MDLSAQCSARWGALGLFGNGSPLAVPARPDGSGEPSHLPSFRSLFGRGVGFAVCRATPCHRSIRKPPRRNPSGRIGIICRLSHVAPKKTKHISLVVCSPNVTILGGLLGLFAFFVLLS